MKEYEIHISASYMTSGGSEEGTYFIEYVVADSMAEAEQIKTSALKVAGYYNIKLDIKEV